MLVTQIAATADTLIVRQLPPVRTTFEQVVFVASGITSIIVLLLIVVAIIAFFAMRRKAKELETKLDELLAELRPLAQNASGLYQDVREVAKDVKEMVDESRETIRTTNERIRTSVVTFTDRVDDISSLIGRVHGSAETVALVASTAISGLKLGARAMGMGKRKKKSKPPAERPRLRRKE